MPRGFTEIDFGANGSTEASVSVTGQTGILETSHVEAWVAPNATADHTADEHLLAVAAGLTVLVATVPVANTGFTIMGLFAAKRPDPRDVIKMYGLFRVAWVWV